MDALGLIQDADKGSWPEGGGTLDQSQSFLTLRNAYHAALRRAGVKLDA